VQAGRRLRNKGKQPYTLVTINGSLKLRRTRWHDPQSGSQTPSDAWLDAAERTISEGVREMACRLNQTSSSFRATADHLARAAHIELSKETLRQLIEGEAQGVLRQMQRAELGPVWSAAECRSPQGPTRLYCGCDGVKVPLITSAEKQKRRENVKLKRRRRGRKCKPLPRLKPGSDNAYKDFKVAYFYDETKQHRFVSVTAGNHEAAGRMLKRMSAQVELPRAEQRIALIDGAPWIRNQFELHGLVEAIGLDFYHLREQVQAARKGVFGDESEEGKRWLDDLMHAFKHQGYDSAWHNVVQLRSTLRSRTKRAALDHLLQYMAERRDMIRYPEFERRGWQIGSGPTEAECKTTTRRVKGRGRRWNANNAESLMALAALHDSRLWTQRWTTLNLSRN
jgi:hypothetical protein